VFAHLCSLPPPWFLPVLMLLLESQLLGAAVGVPAFACIPAIVFVRTVCLLFLFSLRKSVSVMPWRPSRLQLTSCGAAIKGSLLLSSLLLLAEEQYREKTTGCRSPPPFHYAREGRKKSFERGNYPPPPHWDMRAIHPNHIKFRKCSTLALM
jgi:hypothetical protein